MNSTPDPQAFKTVTAKKPKKSPGTLDSHAGPRDRNVSTFYRTVPESTLTEKQYGEQHMALYGKVENIDKKGKHPNEGSHIGNTQPAFPRGSSRERRHAEYSQCTDVKNEKKELYEHEKDRAEAEVKDMGAGARQYYKNQTEGVTPRKHVTLHNIANKQANAAYASATKREGFLVDYPVGHHSKEEHERHRGNAARAYHETREAEKTRDSHLKHASKPMWQPRGRGGAK